MPYIADAAFDAGLAVIIAGGTQLSICSAEPANFAGIAAVELAIDDDVTCGAAQNGATSGRRTIVPASTVVGTVVGEGTHWALHNGTDTMVAAGPLASPVAITDGISYATSAFSIGFPDAVAV